MSEAPFKQSVSSDKQNSESQEKEFCSGIVSVLGRPNVGKSSLCNRLVGEKVAIVSRHPHTTRRRRWGICNGEGYQLVLTDTPGMRLESRNRLEMFMSRERQQAACGTEHHLLVADPLRVAGKEQRAIENLLRTGGGVVWGVINKIDAASAENLRQCRQELELLLFVKRIFLVSALTGEGVEELKKELVSCLPVGPRWFPEEQVISQSDHVQLGELIREQLLRFVSQELPHETTVQIEHWEKRGSLMWISAKIYTRRDSQKAILIGHKGRMIAKIGKSARLALQKHLGCRVHLELQVKSSPNWIDKTELMPE